MCSTTLLVALVALAALAWLPKVARCVGTVLETTNEVTAQKRCVLPNPHEGNCTLGPIVEVDYKNWKGHRRIRRIVPSGRMMRNSNAPWHPEVQWLIGAIDCEDGKHKFFAMDGLFGWKEQVS